MKYETGLAGIRAHSRVRSELIDIGSVLTSFMNNWFDSYPLAVATRVEQFEMRASTLVACVIEVHLQLYN